MNNYLKEHAIFVFMEPTHILLRYGEIFLKGKNRGFFEKKLIDNVKKIAEIKKIKKIQARMIVPYFEKHDDLRNVFGLTSYSLAIRTDKNEENIKSAAISLLKDRKEKTFKVETKRSDKRFPTKSPDMNILVGRYIEENSNMKFDFKNPDMRLNVEINQDGAYLFTEVVKCFGGLPTGVEGKVLLLVENEASLLAGVSIMKRGAGIIPIGFKDFDISLLQKFSPIELKLEIVEDFESLEEFAKEKNVSVLVSGQDFANLKDYDANLLVLKPLVAYNEKEIKEKLEEFNIL